MSDVQPPAGFREYRKIATVFAAQVDEPFVVATKEGVMSGKEGDYLVQAATAEGESWPVDKTIFEATYVPV